MRWLTGFVNAALLLASSIAVPLVSADVVELRSGQRVEGTFKGADDSAVRIEVDGRTVTFAPAEVRAIYYGPALAPPAPVASPAPLPELGEAIGALAMLRSVARTGVTYQEYAPRLSEAQVAVDRYLQAEDGAATIKGAIADSFHLYALAGTAWNAGLSRGNYAAVGTDSALNRCEAAQKVIAESKRRAPFIWRSKGAGEATTTGMVIADEGLAALWSCASDRLAAVERLRTEKKR
jgi:hypothetical protein